MRIKRAGAGVDPHGRAAAVLLVMVAGMAATGFALSTRHQSLIFGEDGIVEWLSAGSMLAAAALAIVGWRHDPAAMGGRDLLALVALTGMAGFLSEISFGARIGGFAMPSMTGGGELDGAQDLVLLAVRLLERVPPAAALLLGVAGATIVTGLARLAWRRGYPARAARRLARDGNAGVVVAALACLVVAVTIDLRETWWTRPVEETLELFAAGLLCLAMIPPSWRPARMIAREGATGIA